LILLQKRDLWLPSISSGIHSDITNTRNTTGIIDALGIPGVFHPAPFGIVGILGAFDVRDCTTPTWPLAPRHRGHCSFGTM